MTTADKKTTKYKTIQRRTTVNNPTNCSTPKSAGSSRSSHLGKLRLLAIAMGAQALMAQHSLAATLDHLSHTTLPGNQQQIAFKLSDPINDPRTFKIDYPARIAIDLMGTTNALDKRVVPVGVGNLESVSIVEANDRTRVVLNLGAMTEYETVIDGDRLLITLDSDALGEEVLLDTDAQDVELFEEEIVLEGGEELLYGDDNLPLAETELVIEEGSDLAENEWTPPVDDGVMVEVPTVMGTDLQQEEMTAESMNYGDIIVETGAPIEEYVENTAPVVPPAPRTQMRTSGDAGRDYSRQPTVNTAFNKTPPQKKDVTYNGQELSLNFQDIEIRSVLQLLADFTDLNIVVSDTVQGKLTLRLKNVPWDQALDIILRTKGLDKRQSGNVVMVAPAGEIAAVEKAEREAAAEAIALEPLRTEFVQVNYAKAVDVAKILKSESGGLISERGNVTIDDRTNTILVNDTSDVLGKVRALVTRLDIPVKQVLIESRIVIATDDFNRELGTRFGVNRDTTNDGEGIIIGGNSEAITNLGNNDGLANERFNVDLAANNPAGTLGLAFAKLPFGTLLELELSAMQAEGRGEVISTPRVITANQREATIEQGVEIPYVTTSDGGTNTQFRKAVLSLKVKPLITPDESIIMDLVVNKDSVGQIVSGVPSIDTREVDTQVLVDNGETVVLGGIYEQTVIQQRSQVPFFGDLPLVGKLFQHNVAEDDKKELLVFVTPQIIQDGQ